MKKGAWFFALLLLLQGAVLGCAPWKPPLETMQSAASQDPAWMLSQDLKNSEKHIDQLIQLAEESRNWRHKVISSYHKQDHYQKSYQGKITSTHLTEIHQLGAWYTGQIRPPLLDMTLSPYFQINLKRDVRVQTQRETYVEKDVVRYFNELGMEVENDEDPVNGTVPIKVVADIYHINPGDRKGQAFLQEFKVSFAAALLLMDNYLLGWDPYMENTVLRRNWLYDLQGKKDVTRKTIKEIRTHYTRYKSSNKWTAALDLYHRVRRMPQAPISGSPDQQLETLIESSTFYKKLEFNPGGDGLMTRVAGKIKFIFQQIMDGMYLVGNQTTYVIVKSFARTTKPFKSRDGKLNNMSQENFNELARQLKPLDVLIEKNPASVVDKFVPGHYGHSAVWLGTESELKELGVWEELPRLYQDAVERFGYDGPPFQESVRKGHVIVDALHPGIDLSSLREFLDIDDLAVTRLKDCPPGDQPSGPCLKHEDKRRYLLEALKQVGKNYDYNFDVNTDFEIVCSEVMYRTFVDMDFPTSKMLGRHTISPDQVASLADSPEDPFELVLLYHDGEMIRGNDEFLQEIMGLLVKEEYSAVEAMTGKRASYY